MPGGRERQLHNHAARCRLRSTALTIQGTAGIPSWDVLTEAFQQVINCATRGQLRIETERVPLAEIEDPGNATRPPAGSM